ncbi:MAG: hypothetical protein ACO307_15505, partial [Ilumatobacteraceae bacterium]
LVVLRGPTRVDQRAGTGTALGGLEAWSERAQGERGRTLEVVAGLRVLRSKREDLPQRKHGNVPL